MKTSADVRIESIAAGGDGVARADGLVLFVPRTAPGDLVSVEFTPRGNFARADLVSVLEASPARVEPECAHYVKDRCGGCQLQHLSYDAQLQAKSRNIADSVRRIAKRDAPAPEVRASPIQWRYRRKLTLALRKSGTAWRAGLHPYDDPASVFSLNDCPITSERVIDVWREIMAASADLPDALELRGAVRVAGEGASCVIEGGRTWAHSGVFFHRVRSLTALWWSGDGKARKLMHKRQSGQAPGASFAQVNTEVAAALRRHVLDLTLAYSPHSAIDAYAGLGDLSAALHERGVNVTAIELDAEASAWCARRLSGRSRTIAGRAEDWVPRELPADVLILNPPRAGIDEGLAASLESSLDAPRAVLYISCNPATLARDLARMPRYRVTSLLAFDMFPQTAHVETVCELVPDPA